MALHNFLTFVVIAISGNPAAAIFGKEGTYIVTFLALMFLWLRRPMPIERSALVLPAAISGLALVQLLSFGSLVLMANLGFIVKIGIGILAATVIDGFFQKFVRWMAILACVSLFFYIPYVVGFDLAAPLSFLNVPVESINGISAIRHIGIHNFHQPYETRNSGMFWEPGAFAGYLVLALFVIVTQGKDQITKRWELLAILAALISTQSTMGFIAGMIVGVYYLINRFAGSRSSVVLPFIPILLLAAGAVIYMAVTELDFLGDKIQEQAVATQVGRDRNEITRFGNVLYDLEFIKERPIAGWSGNPETRFSIDPELAEIIQGQGVALTGFWVRFGAIGWFALMWGLYNAGRSRGQNPLTGFFLVITITALLVGEQYTNFPLIYSFLIGLVAVPSASQRMSESNWRKTEIVK